MRITVPVFRAKLFWVWLLLAPSFVKRIAATATVEPLLRSKTWLAVKE